MQLRKVFYVVKCKFFIYEFNKIIEIRGGKMQGGQGTGRWEDKERVHLQNQRINPTNAQLISDVQKDKRNYL